jgi:hypothetical protein
MLNRKGKLLAMSKPYECVLGQQNKTRIDALEKLVVEHKSDFSKDIKDIKDTVKDLANASNRIAWMVLTTVMAVFGQIIFYILTKKL